MKTAFLVDAEFFLRRLRSLRGDQHADEVVRDLNTLCIEHLTLLDRSLADLYRILVYDCKPLSKKMHLPVSRKAYDLSITPTYSFRTPFHKALRVQRKVALRMGTLNEKLARWQLQHDAQHALLTRSRAWSDLTDADFSLEVKQSGVDMRIGLDIAWIGSKRLADQVVLVSGDSDFIPAAKTARREGIDFILDSMGAPIPDDLHEHIDGLQTVLRRAKPASGDNAPPTGPAV